MSSFGQQEGFKVLLESDPQVQKAVDAIPEARALYQTAKRLRTADRRGGRPSVSILCGLECAVWGVPHRWAPKLFSGERSFVGKVCGVC